MPKAYDAPIPIYRELGIDGNLWGEPVKRYPWPLLDNVRVRSDILRWFEDEPLSPVDSALASASLADRRSIASATLSEPPEWDQRWGKFELPLMARYVLKPMEHMRNLALWAANQYKDDVLGIDDLFLEFCNPRITDHIPDLESGGTDRLESLISIASWGWPLNAKRLMEIAKGSAAPVCWHPGQAHTRRHRGRQWTSARRAATWATYIFSWLTGSESAAVRLWNAWGDDARWGTDDPSGIKKYGVAKRRLVKSLRGAIGPAVTPPNSWARPYHTLPGDVFDTMLAAVQRLRASEKATTPT